MQTPQANTIILHYFCLLSQDFLLKFGYLERNEMEHLTEELLVERLKKFQTLVHLPVTGKNIFSKYISSSPKKTSDFETS